MKIGQKLLIIGLSALMMVTPCFAEHKIVAINGQKVVLNLYEEENRNYVSLYKLENILSDQGYKCSDYNNDSEEIIITKNNKTLTLSRTKGEIKKKIESMAYGDYSVSTYIPLETVIQYFGDSIEYPIPSEIKENFLRQFDAICDIGQFIQDMPLKDKAVMISNQLWDNAMNNLYFILLEELSDNKKKEFEQEQKDWEIYKNKEEEAVRHSQCDHSKGSCMADTRFIREEVVLTRYSLIIVRCYELLKRLP